MKANFPADGGDLNVSRVFFALWPDQGARQRLRDLALAWQPDCGGRVMRAETLHLTLLFLGEVRRDRLDSLCAVAGSVRFGQFAFSLSQFACWRHNRIGYATATDGTAALGQLAQSLADAVSAAGFGFDRRKFVPHVTLLRNIERQVEARGITPVIEWPVAAFSLVESVPGGGAIAYRDLRSWPASLSPRQAAR